jgi:hypothetical protein
MLRYLFITGLILVTTPRSTRAGRSSHLSKLHQNRRESQSYLSLQEIMQLQALHLRYEQWLSRTAEALERTIFPAELLQGTPYEAEIKARQAVLIDQIHECNNCLYDIAVRLASRSS